MAVYGIHSTDKDVSYDVWTGARSGHKPHRTPDKQFFRDEAEKMQRLADAICDQMHDPRTSDDERASMRIVFENYTNLADMLNCLSRGESVTGLRLDMAVAA